MCHVLGKERSQISLICLEELVDADSPARQIDRLVNESDTSYFEKSLCKNTRRPSYDLKDMLKLFVYGYENSAQSSRRLERETIRNVEVMWLLKGLTPDDKTIFNFRRENAKSLKSFFNEFAQSL